MPQKTPSLTSENGSLSENQAHEQVQEQGTQAQAILSLTETSADKLMDSVFEDVDYMLEKGVTSVPTVSAQNSSRSETAEHAIASQEPNQTSDLSTALVDELVVADESLLEQEHSQEPDSAAENNDSAREWYHALKITVPILGACAALGVALAAGFLLHSPSSPFNRGAVAGAEDAPMEPASSEFAGYMQRALDTIARTEQSNPSGRLASNTGETAGDGPPSLPITPGGVANRSLNVPERVYIPVYQPPSPSLPALPSVPRQSTASLPTSEVASSGNTGSSAPSSNQSSSPSASSSSAPSVPTSRNVSPPTVTVSPSNSSPLPTPSVTPLTPTVQVPVQAAPISPSSSAPVLSELSHDHVLVGLLQLGDRSVAMFDFSEGTHRVKVGEQIGTSGWSLVSVSQNEAVIRRNGDVRSIYIGQSF